MATPQVNRAYHIIKYEISYICNFVSISKKSQIKIKGDSGKESYFNHHFMGKLKKPYQLETKKVNFLSNFRFRNHI